jgi:hypothetical protein
MSGEESGRTVLPFRARSIAGIEGTVEEIHVDPEDPVSLLVGYLNALNGAYRCALPTRSLALQLLETEGIRITNREKVQQLVGRATGDMEAAQNAIRALEPWLDYLRGRNR